MRKILYTILTAHILTFQFAVLFFVSPAHAEDKYTQIKFEVESGRAKIVQTYTQNDTTKTISYTYKGLIKGIRFNDSAKKDQGGPIDNDNSVEYNVYQLTYNIYFEWWTTGCNGPFMPLLVVDLQGKIRGLFINTSENKGGQEFDDYKIYTYQNEVSQSRDDKAYLSTNETSLLGGMKTTCKDPDETGFLDFISSLKDRTISGLAIPNTQEEIIIKGKINWETDKVKELAKTFNDTYPKLSFDTIKERINNGAIEIWYSTYGNNHQYRAPLGKAKDGQYSVKLGKVPEGNYIVSACLLNRSGALVDAATESTYNTMHDLDAYGWDGKSYEDIQNSFSENAAWNSTNRIYWAEWTKLMPDKYMVCASVSKEIKEDSPATIKADLEVDYYASNEPTSSTLCPSVNYFKFDIAKVIAIGLCNLGVFLNQAANNFITFATDWFAAVVGLGKY